MNRFLVQNIDRFWHCSGCGWVFNPLKKYAANSVIETLPDIFLIVTTHSMPIAATSSVKVNPLDFA
jgi:hypothetical protein